VSWEADGDSFSRYACKTGSAETFGLLEMQTAGRRRVPTVRVGTLRVEIDPCAMADRIEASPVSG
jgi:hypothetical protein